MPIGLSCGLVERQEAYRQGGVVLEEPGDAGAVRSRGATRSGATGRRRGGGVRAGTGRCGVPPPGSAARRGRPRPRPSARSANPFHEVTTLSSNPGRTRVERTSERRSRARERAASTSSARRSGRRRHLIDGARLVEHVAPLEVPLGGDPEEERARLRNRGRRLPPASRLR